MGITYYNSNPVPVEYTEVEMREIVLGYIYSSKTEFSFRNLSYYIVQKAIEEQKVKNASNTQYSSNEMDSISSIQLSKILWELIWDKKIYIAFGENPFVTRYKGDVRFVPVI